MNKFSGLVLLFLCAANADNCIPGETCLEERTCTADIRCPRFDDGNSAVLVPHPDCRKFFKCSSGRACEYQCPGVLHFNPVQLACDWPDKACCDSNRSCSTEQCIPGLTCRVNDGNHFINQDIPPIVHNTEQRNQTGAFGNNVITCINNHRCPMNDDPYNPVVLQHANCQKFYKCSNGQACELSCPLGFHFNAQTGGCDHPNNACCDSSASCTGSSSISTKCHIDSRCPLYEDSMNPTHLQHSNCSLFYKCANGKACELSCPHGQHFSKALDRCEFPNVACCDTTVPCTATPSFVPVINPPSSETWTGPGNRTACKQDTRCHSVNGPRNLLLRHENCTKFYQCFSGYACEFVCPPGLHFDERRQVCQWTQNSTCNAAA
ncbi:probable chitinase 10 [Topomyia yanbarensis]|uniref:probable chitinase 10 n=1 Tax=Topomyia yanbarensis TaxID=2498891 RepID=UPI00273CA00A|nr:probable chitinase 10 [Topomyia yanbarensis]